MVEIEKNLPSRGPLPQKDW